MAISKTAALFPCWRGDEPYRPLIAPARSAVFARFPQLAAEIGDNPFDRFEAIHAAQPAFAGYTHISSAMRRAIEAIPPHLREGYFRALLLWHVERLDEKLASARLHPEFAGQIADSVHRIMVQIEGEADWADPKRDAYMKDLGIVRLSVIPAVAQLIYPYSGVVKANAIKGGLGAWWYIGARCGGFAPFLEIHTHAPMISAYFNPVGWEETYRLTTLLFATYPRARGMLGTSWFYDPKLLEISPRLAYLQAEPLANGAYSLAAGTDAGTVSTATATSASRRALYEAGKYYPRAYSLVWAKAAMLERYR